MASNVLEKPSYNYIRPGNILGLSQPEFSFLARPSHKYCFFFTSRRRVKKRVRVTWECKEGKRGFGKAEYFLVVCGLTSFFHPWWSVKPEIVKEGNISLYFPGNINLYFPVNTREQYLPNLMLDEGNMVEK